MDLDILKCFRRIVALGSLSKAASELGISQPALTRQIKRLEHTLKTELLVRNSRGVQLTEIGEFLLSRAGPLLDQAELIGEELSARLGSLSGDVAICMPASMNRSVTSPLLADVRRDMPGVRLRVIDGFDAVVHHQLREGLVDIGVLVNDTERVIDGVVQSPLAREPLQLVGKRSAFPAGARLKMKDLYDKELVLPAPGSQVRHQVEELFRRQGKVMRVAIEVDSIQLINDLIADGKLYSVAPQSAVAMFRGNGIAAWPISNAFISWAICIRQRRQQSPIIREISARLTDYVLRSPRTKINR